MEYKGYTLNYYESTKRYSTHKSRPYDDAEYYWAYTYDKQHWVMVYNGKRALTITTTFEKMVDILERHNQNIKPIMCHN